MKARKARAHRHLPDFEWQLRLRRPEIARSLTLDPTDEAAAREIDAALDDLAYWLKRSWLFLRHADRNASIAGQRSILAELVAKLIENLAVIDELDPACAVALLSQLMRNQRQARPEGRLRRQARNILGQCALT